MFLSTFLLLICAAFTQAIDWNGKNWARKCDFKNNDMSNVEIPSDQCDGRCAATKDCTHFTWSKHSGGTCWMKKGGATKNDAIETNDEDMVCGVMENNVTINWNRINWAHKCDFPKADMSNVEIPSEQCGGRCAATKNCTHFTWTKLNGGTCWMKKGGATKNDAIPTNDEDIICGFIENNPGSSGTTTRYWDCCKPSCSWPGKVPGNNKYARACNKDGNGTATDPNGSSSCGGGPVYACNNHQPWAVNDQLAYGFAAATIPDLDERGRCCACYKLDFTNGPVQGKSMIVQVTNSGVDVHPNQFDLQIPGGGVGILNGCSAQWGARWGNRYGAVNRREECNYLPEQIRQGCFWRFDWFRGADNPTMTYVRVRCPDELIAASNCRRDDD